MDFLVRYTCLSVHACSVVLSANIIFHFHDETAGHNCAGCFRIYRRLEMIYLAKRNEFYITWNRLAEKLTIKGYKLEPCHPGNPAWKIPLTSDAAAVISDFYTAHGKAVPGIVCDAMRQ